MGGSSRRGSREMDGTNGYLRVIVIHINTHARFHCADQRDGKDYTSWYMGSDGNNVVTLGTLKAGIVA